ncbi:M18 family aminopeptidase [Collinsella sp. An307]|uniref:M18 family aminopeptidase n=1 Tax=Collinsella sp. An307 TaxID=1965630 RepID=UPI001EF43931|nr:M18 family aminopeptidase [Collinsella sp. An307]
MSVLNDMALNPSEKEVAEAEGLLAFIEESSTAFHAAAAVCARLDASGFTYLPEGDAWHMIPGGSYYTCRNGSSVIAWCIAENALEDTRGLHFQIAAAHSDSPTFRLKSSAVVEGAGGALCLDVEPYGGMIDYTWFDRPLGIAGRLLVRSGSRVESKLVKMEGPVALIPSLAVHLNRGVNDGFAPDRARDVRPVVTAGALDAHGLMGALAASAGVSAQDIVASDLYLVNVDAPRIWGAAREFVSAPRLDDLMCAYTALEGFLGASAPSSINVYALFDNEEVGSNTKQGAMSTLLKDTLQRIVTALDGDDEAYRRALSRSMLVSCDNAHAVHPNRPDKYDELNRCRVNGGIVIKEAANQHYCTDAFSRAIFTEVCERAGVPYQTFANRSDMAGGSTLGNLSNIQASMHGVDVGCAQWAMHATYETAGVRDVSLARRALEAFFAADVRIDGALAFEIA